MDKKNLHYIVEKDTNMRISAHKEGFYIASMKKAADDAETYTKNRPAISDVEYEAISISDYEETYCEGKE